MLAFDARVSNPQLMRTRFITSAVDPDGFPHSNLPEIAFAGRSNVGKSSLLNALTGAKIAKVSRTPGRTQLVNFFSCEGKDWGFTLADLPGYGYAKAPKAVQRTWGPMIERYLETRDPLRALLLLVDVRRGVQEDDVELVRWMLEAAGARSIVIEVVGTKLDKLPKSKQKPALASIGRALGLEREHVHGTSASTRQGLDDLLDHLRALTVGSGGSASTP